MDTETCIVLPAELADTLMRGELLLADAGGANWQMIMSFALFGVIVLEAVRLGAIFYRDYL